jgi:hypothetical protein
VNVDAAQSEQRRSSPASRTSPAADTAAPSRSEPGKEAPRVALGYQGSMIAELRDQMRLDWDAMYARFEADESLHPSAGPVHARRPHAELASLLHRGRRRHGGRVDQPSAAVRDRPAGPLLPALVWSYGTPSRRRESPACPRRHHGREAHGRAPLRISARWWRVARGGARDVCSAARPSGPGVEGE